MVHSVLAMYVRVPVDHTNDPPMVTTHQVATVLHAVPVVVLWVSMNNHRSSRNVRVLKLHTVLCVIVVSAGNRNISSRVVIVTDQGVRVLYACSKKGKN